MTEITKEKLALIKVWDYALQGARNYCQANGYTNLNGQPLISGVTNACESIPSLMHVDFYGNDAILSQSNQLLIEPYTQELGRVFCEIQSFRKEEVEDSDTAARRLAQFSLFEIEIKGGLDLLLEEIKMIVQSMAWAIHDYCQDDLLTLGLTEQDISELDDLKFGQMTYTEAVVWLRHNGFPEIQWGDDLKARHESKLTEQFGAVFCTHYPAPIKFFNMKNDLDNEEVVLSSDLLLPFSGESVGCAERETDFVQLTSKLESSEMLKMLMDQGIPRSAFDRYLNYHDGRDVKQHSGAGLGLNRIFQSLLKKSDIKDATPFVINKETFEANK